MQFDRSAIRAPPLPPPKKKERKKNLSFSRKWLAWPLVSGVENLPWKVHGGEEIPPVNRKQGREEEERGGVGRRRSTKDGGSKDWLCGTRGGWLSSPWKEKSGLRRLVKEQLPYSWATKQRAKARGEKERERGSREGEVEKEMVSWIVEATWSYSYSPWLRP